MTYTWQDVGEQDYTTHKPMNDIAIHVENLSKQYYIGGPQQVYPTFRDALTNIFASPLRRAAALLRGHAYGAAELHEAIWALKDISFEVKRGEVMGIIGRNGAGKSTLLKILSRITEPTTGYADIYGRVGSLLEVGTGFHPELTGRENIYLNGSILGLKRHEIKQKFDEIVAFSGVEQFIDTPVKHYSSGMQVRLAFAVAAHLEPEILIVDEVLAVGDAEFQKKCLGKMSDVTGEGRTVLFVSHNMAAVQGLCSRAVLLNEGKVATDGKVEEVIKEYLQGITSQPIISLAERKDRQGNGSVRFTKIEFLNTQKEPAYSFFSGQQATFVLSFENQTNQQLQNLHVAISIDNQMGQRITLLSNRMTGEVFQAVPQHINQVEIQIERLPLVSGRYYFTIFSEVNGIIADWIKSAGFFDVEAGDYYGTGKMPPQTQGDFMMDHSFKLVDIL
jgi:lipopolysaccharide transport system ATP-binding protein